MEEWSSSAGRKLRLIVATLSFRHTPLVFASSSIRMVRIAALPVFSAVPPIAADRAGPGGTHRGRHRREMALQVNHSGTMVAGFSNFNRSIILG